jgi:hypothetical protein
VGSLKEKESLLDHCRFHYLRVIRERKVERGMKRMWGVGLKMFEKESKNRL